MTKPTPTPQLPADVRRVMADAAAQLAAHVVQVLSAHGCTGHHATTLCQLPHGVGR